MDTIKQKIQELLAKIKCTGDVIEEEVANSELEAEYEQYKSTVAKLADDLKNCSAEEDKLEVLK